MDIDGWLRGIDLAQYAEMFRANNIDGELLGRLTNDDLKDIGVASFGHRKKLLEAIAALVAAPETLPPIPATEPKTQDTAERRQVTIVFSDLVGSTALPPLFSWVVLVGSWRNTWAMACWCISAIRGPMRTTPSARCGRGSS